MVAIPAVEYFTESAALVIRYFIPTGGAGTEKSFSTFFAVVVSGAGPCEIVCYINRTTGVAPAVVVVALRAY